MNGLEARPLAADQPGKWNRRIRQFNRAVLNPLMLRVADRLHRGYPAVVRHVGRRSGRGYRTPVVAQPVAGGFVIPLPYGADTDWCRNVRAAGRFVIDRSGETYDVGDPKLIGAEEAVPLVPERMRRVWRRYRIGQFLSVRTSEFSETRSIAHGTSRATHWKPAPARGKESTMEMEEAKRHSERVTGVSNVAYDLMVALTNKLEGVAAMEEHKLDADAANDFAVRATFELIEQREREDIEELRGFLMPHLPRIQLP